MDQKIEALLFVAGEEGLTLEELSQLLHISSSYIKEGIDILNQRLKKGALEVVKKQDAYVLVTKSLFDNLLKDYATQELNQRLTKPALEVLSVIAYKQPVTRVEIDEIRGVQSSMKALQKLLSYGLVEEVGRLEQPGRPKLYGTTHYFLEYFNLKNLEELPPLNLAEEEKVEEELFTQLLDFN